MARGGSLTNLFARYATVDTACIMNSKPANALGGEVSRVRADDVAGSPRNGNPYVLFTPPRVQGEDQPMSDPFPRLLIEQLHIMVAHRLFESIRISDDVSAIIEILDDTTRSEL